MNTKALFTAIASGALALTIGFGQAKAAEIGETTTKVANHNEITMVASSQATAISGKYPRYC